MKRAKHLIILALVLVFGCLPANALFRFGVKAGLNVNKLHFNERTFDADNRCGFTVGATSEFVVPIIGVGFDLSLMYTRMNSENDEWNGDYVPSNSQSLGKNFLEIPLNVRYKLSLPAVESIIAPYIFTGPTLALKLDKGDNSIWSAKTAQWGWNLGLGVQLIRHLQIGAGYTFGINNVVKNIKSDMQVANIKVKNNYWTITAAWLF